MADLDEISRVLGRIEGSVEETRSQVAALFDKHDRVNEEVIEQRGAMKMLAVTSAEIKTAHDALAVKVRDHIDPTIDDYKATKNKSIGAAWGVGLAGGGLGAGLITLVQRFLGLSGHGP